DAKIIEENGKIFLLKNCPIHGEEKVLTSDDYEYYKFSQEFIRPSDMPFQWNTEIKKGCPFDCGLCSDHEQHSCLSVVEITEACNLNCPICYANSGTQESKQHLSMEKIKKMLDLVVANEKEPDIIQISGGEPTIHPEFFAVLDYAKTLPVRHLMVNTNGLKIATDENFTKKLSEYMPQFEIYLQFDGLEDEIYLDIRGAKLLDTKKRALEMLNKYNISTTLVVTLKRGVNDNKIGDIMNFAMKQKCVRGVTFQPVQIAGRHADFSPEINRLTLSEVRREIYTQSNFFKKEDIIPVPCHPECLAMGYGLKLHGDFVPLTSFIDKKILLDARNTISYETNDEIKNAIQSLFSLNTTVTNSLSKLNKLLCCLPKVLLPKQITYENVFRIIIMKFQDAHDMDMKNIKKSCVHIVHPDGEKIIPFETYNLFYRGKN
ncbi:MAG: radical SAM protein, partial [Fusobacteriaceae bacterium]